MALPQLIDFRATAGFVSDPANAFAELQLAAGPSNADYPTTTAQGNNVGWETTAGGGLLGRDRNAGIDARLAGMNFSASSNATFRIDLPSAATYNVNAAFGDASYNTGTFTAQFKDTTTVLSTPVNNTGTGGGGHFFDATGVERTSAADWVSNNATQSLTFSTTIFRTFLTTPAGNFVIAHLAIAAAPAVTVIFRRELSQFGTRVGSRQVHFG